MPYPHAADDHQTYNARCFEKAGAALLAPEEEINAVSLAKLVGGLLGSPGDLSSMKVAARGLSVDDAAARICDMLEPD